jgi:protein-disulfide isomerase
MPLVDRVATASGFLFLGLTVFVLGQPGSPVRVSFDEWRAAREAKSTIAARWEEFSNSDRFVGMGNGPTLVEFTDYRCGFCRSFHDSSKALLTIVPNGRIAIRHIARSGDKIARGAAAAALCANEQDKFLAMHSFLLSDDTWESGPNWSAIAATVGVPDTLSFSACLSSGRVDVTLQQDSSLAASLGIKGTPAFASPRYGLHVGLLPNSQLVPWFKRDT